MNTRPEEDTILVKMDKHTPEFKHCMIDFPRQEPVREQLECLSKLENFTIKQIRERVSIFNLIR